MGKSNKSDKEIWNPPQQWGFPPEMYSELPGEPEVKIVFETFLGKNPPVTWTMENARNVVNTRRKDIVEDWKSNNSK